MLAEHTGSGSRRSVLFVINSLAGGGAERVMTTLLRASSEHGSRSEAGAELVLVLLDREAAAYQVPDGIRMIQLDCRHSLLRAIPALLAVFRRERPAAIVSFLTRANVAAIVAGRLLRLPVIISERVNTTSHLGQTRAAVLARKLIRWSYPRARRIIAVSPGVADDLRRSFGIPEEKLVVISNPVDSDEIRRQADLPAAIVPARPFIMAMGRLVPNKNFSMLIDAYHQANPAEDLLILGEGPERPRLERQVEALGLAGRVHLAGFAENPFAILRQAAIFVLPSNAEGFPNSLLEAMTLGVPVISTNCLSGPAEVLAGLPREAITPCMVMAEHGILVTPDSVGDMAAALRAMAAPTCRDRYRERAAARAADFSVARARDAYWRVIQQEIEPRADKGKYGTADAIAG